MLGFLNSLLAAAGLMVIDTGPLLGGGGGKLINHHFHTEVHAELSVVTVYM